MVLRHSDPDTAGWSWADLGITEAQAQAIPVSAEVEEYSARKASRVRSLVAATPGIAILQRIAAELVAMGVTVRYVDGWGSRGYLPLNPAGLINHWIVSTYGGTARQQTLGLIVRGHSSLSGPLANIYMDFDGTVVLVAALSANHGGVGSWRGVSGNSRWLGVECEGGPILQPAQIATLPLLNAAVGRALGRDPAAWCIGHNEYSPGRKIDIGRYMPPARAEAARLWRGGSPRDGAPEMNKEERTWLQGQLNHISASLSDAVKQLHDNDNANARRLIEVLERQAAALDVLHADANANAARLEKILERLA